MFPEGNYDGILSQYIIATSFLVSRVLAAERQPCCFGMSEPKKIAKEFTTINTLNE